MVSSPWNKLTTDGHYLNLPVVDSENTVIGIVDVLKLTYATLEQVNQMNTPEGEGPMWNRFWNTLDNDTESVHSDGVSAAHSHRPETPNSPSHIRGLSGEHPSLNRYTSDSVVPNDSASFAAVQDREESTSAVGEFVVPSPTPDVSFVFKFKTPSGRVHRVRFDPSLGMEEFRGVLAEKLTTEEIQTVGGAIAEDAGFAVSFVDDEGDIVSILSVGDLAESVAIAKRTGRDKVDLYIHHPNQPPRPEPPSTVLKTVVPDVVEKVVETANHSKEKVKESISGVPNELLLPGAIVVLAVVIIGVFVATRAGGGPGKLRY
jgi:hypothetical protein